MKIFLPQNINIDADINKLDVSNPRLHIDKLKYLVSSIYTKLLVRRNNDKLSNFVPMNASILQILFHQKYYLQLMDFAKDYYIRCNEQWTINQTSKKYSLKKQLIDYDYKIDELSNPKYEHALIKSENSENEICKHQLSKLNELTLDENVKQHIADKPYKKTNARQSRYFLIDKFNLQAKYCFIDNTSYRLHSNLTILAKDVRNHLQYKYKLYNIDITNSQPFFIAMMLSRGTIKHKHFSSDVDHFIRLTTSGDLYEYLASKLSNMTRDDVKNEIYRPLYNNPKYQDNDDPVTKTLYTEFPNVYDFILDQKENDYREFAINMQKVESDMMIQSVYRRITKERPDILALTIHDSIVAAENDVEYVQDVIYDEFDKKYKLKPKLNIELL